MKKVRLIVLSMLIGMISLSPSVFATNDTRNVEENIITIDVGHIKPAPEKLVADYHSDFNDLVEQLMNLHPDFQLWKSEFESQSHKSSPERKEELRKLITNELERFELTAEMLLEARYEDNKTNLLPEILDATQSTKVQSSALIQPKSTDVVWYGTNHTRSTGNYGSNAGDASYSHSANNNVLKAKKQAIPFGESKAISGWQFMAGIAYPNETFQGTLKFRQLSLDAIASCSIKGYTATIEARTSIYNSTANQIVGSPYIWKIGFCNDQDIQLITDGPSMVTYSNVNFRNSHIYNAFVELTTTSTGGVADAKDSGRGAKWGYIEVLF